MAAAARARIGDAGEVGDQHQLRRLDLAFEAREVVLRGHHPALTYILFLDRYRSGDHAAALLEASQIDLPRDIFSPVSLAMAHGALGHQAAAEEAVRRIRAMAPDFAEHAIEGFRQSNFDEDIIREIAQGLARAGLALKQPAAVTQ